VWQRLSMQHQTIVVVDVARFTDPARTAHHQLAVREGLYKVLKGAFIEAGVDLDNCTVEDRGDGKLILMPPDVDNGRLADQLPSRLVAGLRRHNAVHSAEAEIKLRVALHTGEVRHDEQGAVGQAVNEAFRIVELQEAKSALMLSTGALALIASDAFYRDVIVHDPATDPSSYQRILISTNETLLVAWLRLPDLVPADGSRVLDILPSVELQRLREWLVNITIPQLRTLVYRAAAPGVPPARGIANAWEAFSYLVEFNAGPDGFPSALMFVELLALHVDGDMSANLREWNDDQVRRLRLEPQLQERRMADYSSISTDTRLYLIIVMEPDGIDPNRYSVSHWRQDNPEMWPPARGETYLVSFDELERCVDDLVVNAEKAWSGHEGSVALEFVLPRVLLNLPVHRWHKEHDSGDPRPLCLDYPIVVRSLERMRSSHWHRVWHLRWQVLTKDPSARRVHFGLTADTAERHRIDAILSDPRCVLMVLTAAPSQQPRPGTDELTAALRSGLPALIWHPEASSEVLREVVTRLVEDDGLCDLPGRAQAFRRASFQVSGEPLGVNILRDLVVLWDDPHRLVIANQTAEPPPDRLQSRGDIVDERGRAS
jgi:vWA-MoxR associated protein C-terminal domain/vWA-MoxR associated protein middle region 0